MKNTKILLLAMLVCFLGSLSNVAYAGLWEGEDGMGQYLKRGWASRLDRLVFMWQNPHTTPLVNDRDNQFAPPEQNAKRGDDDSSNKAPELIFPVPKGPEDQAGKEWEQILKEKPVYVDGVVVDTSGFGEKFLKAEKKHLEQAMKKLSADLGVDRSEINVLQCAYVSWSSSACGVYRSQTVDLCVMTNGFQIKLEYKGVVYQYHDAYRYFPEKNCGLPTVDLTYPDMSPGIFEKRPIDQKGGYSKKFIVESRKVINGLVVDDLAQKLGAREEDIKILNSEFVAWPNPNIGDPNPYPTMSCLQVITYGFKISLSYQGKVYTYHTDLGKNSWGGKLLDADMKPVKLPPVDPSKVNFVLVDRDKHKLDPEVMAKFAVAQKAGKDASNRLFSRHRATEAQVVPVENKE